jgi:hypothetical protein
MNENDWLRLESLIRKVYREESARELKDWELHAGEQGRQLYREAIILNLQKPGNS